MTVAGEPYRHHTHRLDLEDPSIREWTATVLSADPDQGIVLDQSAFYPGGGGQPSDHGVLLWGNVRTRIVGTRKGDGLYLLAAEGDPLPPAGTSVHGGLDDERRTSLMRTHSGLHVLSAIVLRDFGAPVTGGNMEPLIARMDFDLPDVPADFKQRVEDACNQAARLNRQIDVRVLPREQAMAIPNIIRTASDLLPPDIEMVRIVDINGIDIQADGGTHVASTAMIGRIAVTKMESKGRGFRACGSGSRTPSSTPASAPSGAAPKHLPPTSRHARRLHRTSRPSAVGHPADSTGSPVIRSQGSLVSLSRSHGSFAITIDKTARIELECGVVWDHNRRNGTPCGLVRGQDHGIGNREQVSMAPGHEVSPGAEIAERDLP